VIALITVPAHATFPGKNGRIAFVQGPDIYTMNQDGSNVRQLTALTDGGAFWVNWSPDGKQIVFVAIRRTRFLRPAVADERGRW
jgi:Tol biopolymer transport system component